jgi:hypothetical protein
MDYHPSNLTNSFKKVWNYCNILRDDLSACGHAQADGLSYLLARGPSILAAGADAQASGDYPSAGSGQAPAVEVSDFP